MKLIILILLVSCVSKNTKIGSFLNGNISGLDLKPLPGGDPPAGADPDIGCISDCDPSGQTEYKLTFKSDFSVINSGHRGATRANDIWGWKDSVTGKEYALLGLTNKTSIIDISNSSNPIHVADLVSYIGTSSTWRDIKVFGDYMLVVSEVKTHPHGIQIFDLNKLRSIPESQFPRIYSSASDYTHYDKFNNAHNIVVNEQTGYAYAVGVTHASREEHKCMGGLHMVDINNPLVPVFKGCAYPGNSISSLNLEFTLQDNKELSDPPTYEECFSRSNENSENIDLVLFHDEEDACGIFYTHDAQCIIYDGPDVEHRGKEVCAVSNGVTSVGDSSTQDFHFIDVTNKSRPVKISTYLIPNMPGYAHQGWFTEDFKYFIANDELDEKFYQINTRTLIIDVTDLDNPKKHMDFMHESRSIDHNLYVKGERAYLSNYNSGLRVLDISKIDQKIIKEVGFYDPTPNQPSSAQTGGVWSNYPFFESGKIIVSHIEGGSVIILEEQVTP